MQLPTFVVRLFSSQWSPDKAGISMQLICTNLPTEIQIINSADRSSEILGTSLEQS